MKRHNHAVCILVAICLGSHALLLQAAEQAGDTSPLLARVNGYEIRKAKVESFVKAFLLGPKKLAEIEDIPVLQRRRLMSEARSNALRALIDRRVLLQEARRLYEGQPGIEEKLKEAVEKRLLQTRRKMGSMVKMVANLHDAGMTLDDWRQFTRNTIMITSYVQHETSGDIRVRPAEIRRYYGNHTNKFRRPARIVYRVIIVDPAGCENQAEEKAKAERILQRIRDGADFGKMAERHSLNRDTTRGGLREVKPPEDAPDWRPGVCRGLKPGEVSDVRKSSSGYEIAKLEKVQKEHVAPFEGVQGKIREILKEKKQEKAREALVRELKQKADITLTDAGRQMLGGR
jgi:hypothetical protein